VVERGFGFDLEKLWRSEIGWLFLSRNSGRLGKREMIGKPGLVDKKMADKKWGIARVGGQEFCGRYCRG
jgi:hypothetical protein